MSEIYKLDLLAHLAHVEELTTQQIITIVKNILIDVATGQKIDDVNKYYQGFYLELDKRFTQEGRRNPNSFRNLWEFYEFWKNNNLPTYSSRREFVANLYNENNAADSETFWSLLHPDIVAISKKRYENGHVADAVEATLKEINYRIKTNVKQLTGEVLDGSALMNRAFSVNNPILVLDDLDTEDGANIQKGYMQIFSGAMIGIRNPATHSNIVLEPEDAIHMLFLSSHLLYKFEASQPHPTLATTDEDESKKIFLRLKDTDSPETLSRLKIILSNSKGTSEVILVIGSNDSKKIIRLPLKVKYSKTLINNLENLLGKGMAKYQ